VTLPIAGVKEIIRRRLGLADNEKVCYEQAERVKTVLILSGFVPNRYKCIWKPVQSLVWLG
jgi:hypothetical protein